MPELASFASNLETHFSPKLIDAISAAALPGLGDGPKNQPLVAILQSASAEKELGESQKHAQACISGLWLLAGDLDRSHTISQDLPSAEGSFLHGIMHRREGDFSNAKYWFRRVGTHEIVDAIAHEAGDVYNDPFDFVDRCSDAVKQSDAELTQQCRDAQWIEWQWLMSYLCG
ncbi:MAG: hypothetical protein WBD20_25020 [Pirellulaceae bacterium]